MPYDAIDQEYIERFYTFCKIVKFMNGPIEDIHKRVFLNGVCFCNRLYAIYSINKKIVYLFIENSYAYWEEFPDYDFFARSLPKIHEILPFKIEGLEI